MTSDYLVLREIISPSKGALIWALVTAQHHGAAASPHVAHDVRLYLIRTWGSVSKTRKKEILTFIVYKNKKYLIK
jgi:hypothetical protein